MSDYDQIYLVPTGISTIRSRSDVDLHSDFENLFPIFSSPMKGISGHLLVSEMGRNNSLGILHRFDSIEDRMKNIDLVAKENVPFGVAIGVNDWINELDIAEYAQEQGAIIICLDLANGYLPQIREMGERLRNRLGKNIKLITGNIINNVGAQYAKDSGFDMVRCSIGSGNVCSTRNVTGIGRNVLSVLKECLETNIELIIDGGIQHPGDIVKSFWAGADYAMIGSLLAYANEAESNDGKLFGMASFTNHELNGKEVKSIEGVDKQIDISKKRPLKEILSEILWGIRSACTYLDCKSYKEIPSKSYAVNVNEFLRKEGECTKN